MKVAQGRCCTRPHTLCSRMPARRAQPHAHCADLAQRACCGCSHSSSNATSSSQPLQPGTAVSHASLDGSALPDLAAAPTGDPAASAAANGLHSTAAHAPLLSAEPACRLPAHGQAAGQSSPTERQVLLYVPNCIGYLRLALLALALALNAHQPLLAFWLHALNLVLDGADGLAARRLEQVSGFGAFLDVVVDNMSRGVLWSLALPPGLGVLPCLLEMTVFTCTHRTSGKDWKTGYFRDAPPWVRAVMDNGFKTPVGAFVVLGLMGCPLWCWACKYLPGTIYCNPYAGLVLAAGRLMTLAVELWVVYRHITGLLQEDVCTRQDRLKATQTT